MFDCLLPRFIRFYSCTTNIKIIRLKKSTCLILVGYQQFYGIKTDFMLMPNKNKFRKTTLSEYGLEVF